MNDARLAQRFDWWWRSFQLALDDIPDDAGAQAIKDWHLAHRWRMGAELAARDYELVRRVYREKQLPSFRDLSPTVQARIEKVAGGITRSPIVFAIGQPVKDEGFTQPVQFNLRLTESALESAVKQFIAIERARIRVAPARGLSGQVNRGPSWVWPEMIDRADHRAGSIDYSMKRKAVAQANKVAPKIFSAAGV